MFLSQLLVVPCCTMFREGEFDLIFHDLFGNMSGEPAKYSCGHCGKQVRCPPPQYDRSHEDERLPAFSEETLFHGVSISLDRGKG